MKALIQRVSEASVDVGGTRVGHISAGLLVFLGVDKSDDAEVVQRLADKVMNYRIFSDENGKMNRSLIAANGEMLVVSQFTLSADTQKGLRPSFTSAADPELANALYQAFVTACRKKISRVETGQFAADMQVSLVNDGPVTFLLEA